VETAAAKSAVTETAAAKTAAMKPAVTKTAMEPAAANAMSLGSTNPDAGGKRDNNDGKAHPQLATHGTLLFTFRIRFRHWTLDNRFHDRQKRHCIPSGNPLFLEGQSGGCINKPQRAAVSKG
jgi:hypothetical protein